LQCYGHLLEQVGSLSVVASDVCRLSTDLIDQFNGLLVPDSRRFNDHWVKYVDVSQTAVLADLDGS